MYLQKSLTSCRSLVEIVNHFQRPNSFLFSVLLEVSNRRLNEINQFTFCEYYLYR